METKEVQALESYFKTENEHWNGYAFEMLCEVIQKQQFKDPETPLQLFSNAVDIFMEQFATPLKAVQAFERKADKKKLDPAQKLFVFEWVLKYVKYSTFDQSDMMEIKNLLKSLIERLRKEANKKPEYTKPITGNIRDTLKEFMQKELAQLPITLKDIEPIQRLNILCKLMPYVLPKTDSVKHNFGEPDEFKIKQWHD